MNLSEGMLSKIYDKSIPPIKVVYSSMMGILNPDFSGTLSGCYFTNKAEAVKDFNKNKKIKPSRKYIGMMYACCVERLIWDYESNDYEPDGNGNVVQYEHIIRREDYE